MLDVYINIYVGVIQDLAPSLQQATHPSSAGQRRLADPEKERKKCISGAVFGGLFLYVATFCIFG